MGSRLEMKDTEIEEGEVQDFDIEEGEVQDFDIDPDLALSYIGEKVQTLLGHFKKDFEGAISYENLGARFGGYGSFLCSDHENENESPRKQQDKKPNSFASRTRKAVGLKSGAVENPVINTCDRVKVGKHVLESSPTSILQIMTSYPGELLLSPLSEDLINLNHRGKCENKPADSMYKKSSCADVKKEKSSFANSSGKGGNLKSKLEVDSFKRMKSEQVHFDDKADTTKVKNQVHVLGISKREDSNSDRKRRMNEACESDHHTEKKARFSKLGGKDRKSWREVNSNNMSSLDREYLYPKSLSRRNESEDKYRPPSKGDKFIGGTLTETSKGKSQNKSGHQEHDAAKLPNQEGVSRPHSLPRIQQTKALVSGSQKLNGVKRSTIRHPIPTPNSSSLQRDSSSHNAATSVLKEANNLKQMADRLKNSGSVDSNWLCFEAALKFLQGASLLESGISEATEPNDSMHSMDIYSNAAKLCESCAQKYENSKDMAGAALAYKCMEVAYMRVVYLSHVSSRDLNELQKALQIDTLGGKRNHASFLRVLNIAQNVNFAMDASRKSRIALTAATEETSNKESISSLKKAMDFSFQDVEGFLALARKALVPP